MGAMEIKKIGESIEHTYVVSSENLSSEFWPCEVLYLMGEGELNDDWIDSLVIEGMCGASGALTKTGKQAAVFLKKVLVVVNGHLYSKKTLAPLPLETPND